MACVQQQHLADYKLTRMELKQLKMVLVSSPGRVESTFQNYIRCVGNWWDTLMLSFYFGMTRGIIKFLITSSLKVLPLNRKWRVDGRTLEVCVELSCYCGLTVTRRSHRWRCVLALSIEDAQCISSYVCILCKSNLLDRSLSNFQEWMGLGGD